MSNPVLAFKVKVSWTTIDRQGPDHLPCENVEIVYLVPPVIQSDVGKLIKDKYQGLVVNSVAVLSVMSIQGEIRP